MNTEPRGMLTRPQTYTVQQVARMAGISVRALHHYDQIRLLRPEERSPAGYRLYGARDLLRLQQILFYRELGLPLDEIRRMLDDPGFDPLQALESHRQALSSQVERLQRLIGTVDRTIKHLTEGSMELTNEELYEGFSAGQAEQYRQEAIQSYSAEMVAGSEKRLRKLSKQQWQAIKGEGEQITRDLSELAERDPGDPQVQSLIARHRDWIENFYPVTEEIYRGLGQLYTSHPDFRANYDRYRPGLADFMQAAMNYYCDHGMPAQA